MALRKEPKISIKLPDRYSVSDITVLTGSEKPKPEHPKLPRAVRVSPRGRVVTHDGKETTISTNTRLSG